MASHTTLAPILRRTLRSSSVRRFSTTAPTASQIGKTPIILPPEVTLSIYTPPPPKNPLRNIHFSSCTVSGPLGTLTIPIHPFLTITKTSTPDSTSSKATVSVDDAKIPQQRQMWGTTRAVLQNHVLGVTEGHTAILRFVGVGYRAIVEPGTVEKGTAGETIVNLKLGYSHPIELVVPLGVKASAPVPTRLLLEGANREVVMQFAADVRKWRKPEPYKGKGIFVNDETIRLKAKKIK